MKHKTYCYFVEGQDEKKIIDTLKTDLRLIQPGKVQIINPVQDKIAASRLLPLKPGTTVILVFDTDTDNSQILKTNIEFISSRTNILKVLCVTQVKNLEDEILRSCTIKHIQDLTNSKSDKEYKADLIHITNLAKRLVECGFKPEMFWAREPRDAFSDIKNDAQYIWIKQSLNDCKKT